MLILLGGLGFFVIADLTTRFRSGKRQPLSLHTRIALLSTVGLVTLGFVMILVLEWNNPDTLASHGLGSKFLLALFQSVTTRTAGFNSLDFASMTTPTTLFVIALMFIGANPGSTGGGIKTVTSFVLLGTIWSTLRGRGQLFLFGRQITLATVLRALVIVLVALFTVALALFFLTLTDADKTLIELAFESVSAFATVGLSLGITADLSTAGKSILILLMYLGRVGLFTIAISLIREDKAQSIQYPTEEVIIG